MQQGTRDSESAPAVTVTVSFVWLGRLAVFSMRNTAKTLVFHRGAAGWSRLVGARKGVRLTPGGGGRNLWGVYFWHGIIFPWEGEQNKSVEKRQRTSKRREEKKKEEKNKRRGTGLDCGEEAA